MGVAQLVELQTVDLAVAGSSPVTHPWQTTDIAVRNPMQPKWTWISLIALAVAAAGCKQTVLNQEKTLDIGPGDYRELIIDSAPRDQNVKVEVNSSAGPVGVFVFLEKDKAAAKRDIDARKIVPANVLALSDKTDKATMEVMIPANNEAVVAVTHASKKTSVTIKLTN